MEVFAASSVADTPRLLEAIQGCEISTYFWFHMRGFGRPYEVIVLFWVVKNVVNFWTILVRTIKYAFIVIKNAPIRATRRSTLRPNDSAPCWPGCCRTEFTGLMPHRYWLLDWPRRSMLRYFTTGWILISSEWLILCILIRTPSPVIAGQHK